MWSFASPYRSRRASHFPRSRFPGVKRSAERLHVRKLFRFEGASQLQVSIELLGLPIAVVQSSFLRLASSFYQKCNLPKARVIIYAYHHVRLLPPESLVVKRPKCTQVEGADTVMQSSAAQIAPSDY